MAREWRISREAQDQLAWESHTRAAAAYDSGFFDPLVRPWSGAARDNNLRPDTSREKLAQLRTAFAHDDQATLTAGNSTPLTDGAAAVLLASEDWARRTAAVDFVHDEGLLMAPTIAVADLLQKTGLSLQDFDYYEIHEAFAAQVLCTLAAWESDTYCRQRLGLEQAMGPIARERLNIHGSSLAVGHPFAATGARILGTLAQTLQQAGRGRGLISICTAGGMGVAAILEHP
jgi:acetyl-CoA C-acetyltransferase